MDMKTLKIINGIVWAVIAIVLNIMVVHYWGEMACPVKSLVLGCILFTAFCVCFWFCIHNHFNEVENR